MTTGSSTTLDTVNFNVYDSATFHNGGYWQLEFPRGQSTGDWLRVQTCAEMGIPTYLEKELRVQQAPAETEYVGAIRELDQFWFYRFYPAGSHSVARRRQWYCAIMRLRQPSDLALDRTGQLFDACGKLEGNPLNYEPLRALLAKKPTGDRQVGDSNPSLACLVAEVQGMDRGEHRAWVVTSGVVSRTFKELPMVFMPAPKSNPPTTIVTDPSVKPPKSNHKDGSVPISQNLMDRLRDRALTALWTAAATLLVVLVAQMKMKVEPKVELLTLSDGSTVKAVVYEWIPKSQPPNDKDFKTPSVPNSDSSHGPESPTEDRQDSKGSSLPPR